MKRTMSKMVYITIAVGFLIAGPVCGLLWTSGAIAQDGPDPDPSFAVDTAANHVHGHGWPDGAQVTLTIDDPNTIQSPDYTDTQMSAVEDGDTVVRFWPGEAFEISPGHVVTLTDGATVKQHTVTSLTVTGFDVCANTIWGMAEPGTLVVIMLRWDTSIIRWETADVDGNWHADFSTAGDEPGEEKPYDFVVDTWLMVYQEDNDGDKTQIDWQAPDSSMEIRLTQNGVQGSNWPLDTELSLIIDDPSNGTGIDFSDTQYGVPSGGDPNVANVWFELGNAFRVRSGHIVTLNACQLSKTHVVANLSVTAVDFEADIVSGMADPGSDIWIRCAREAGTPVTIIQHVQRWEQADGAGYWSADFSVPGDQAGEQDTIDVLPVVPPGATAHQYDDDGDSSQVTWPIHLSVSVAGDDVSGENWLAGDPVTLTIDDPTTLEAPDYSDTAVPQAGPWYLSGVDFNFRGVFDVEPGHVVTLVQGAVTKVHVVTDVSITAIDVGADTVAGTAAPGAHVYVTIGENENNRHEIADSDGNWLADFSVFGDENYEQYTFDLQPDTGVLVQESDEDGNSTGLTVYIPYPKIYADLTPNRIDGYDWTLGDDVTLTIDDPETSDGVDYVATQTPAPMASNPMFGWVRFELGEDLILYPGFIVTMSNDESTREHVIADFQAAAFDVYGDNASGWAQPGSFLWVYFHVGDHMAWRGATADMAGNWLADFTVPGVEPWEQEIVDLTQASIGYVTQYDEDRDRTSVVLPASMRTFHVSDKIYAPNWQFGRTLTVEIDDPTTEPNPDYSTTAVPGPGPGATTGVGIELFGIFDILPGHLLTLSQGAIQKTQTVADPSIASVNHLQDTVYGTATPGAEVRVMIEVETGTYDRLTYANANGDWSVDFSVPGGHPGEGAEPYDILPTTVIEARESDEDADTTNVFWMPPEVLLVDIDIKPGSDPNCFNNDGHGVIPVAVLTTNIFDAATVNPFSVELDGAGARVKGQSGSAGALEDVDNDGDLDLVVQIEDLDGTYDEGDTTATLTGYLKAEFGGTAIEGTDSICIVP